MGLVTTAPDGDIIPDGWRGEARDRIWPRLPRAGVIDASLVALPAG